MLIATSDSANYITHFVRDGAGHITDKIVYENEGVKITPEMTFADLKIKDLKEHAHTYYIPDHHGHPLMEVDALGYATLYERFGKGLIKRAYRYATKVNPSYYKHTKVLPDLQTCADDEVTEYTYDLLDRMTLKLEPNGKATTIKYNNMGEKSYIGEQDAFNPERIDGDNLRAKAFLHDDFGDVGQELNAYLCLTLERINRNLGLSAKEKQRQVDELWELYAQKNVRNARGLIIRQVNSLGYHTLFYYDDDRRLVASIDATGAVIQRKYDSRTNITHIRAHKNRLPKAILNELKGGDASENILNILQNNQTVQDSEETREFNQRDLKVKEVDPEACSSEFLYNAHKELTDSYLPINDKKPSLHIAHGHDNRGNEIKTTKKAGNLETITEQSFNHPDNLLTQKINENKVVTDLKYDKLDRLESIKIDKRESTLEQDAFNHLLVEVNALKDKTTHKHNTKQRIEEIIGPDGKRIQTLTKNIFGEEIELEDGLNNKEKWVHAPDGQLAQHINAQNVTDVSNEHNSEGWLERRIDALGVSKKINTNEVGQKTSEIEDEYGLGLTTHFEPNASGNDEKITLPNGVIIKQEFNRRQEHVDTLFDPITDKNPLGINLLTTNRINAAGLVTDILKGKNKEESIWHLKKSIDELGRETGTILDPDKLAITTHQVLDKKSQVFYEYDTRGMLHLSERDNYGNILFIYDQINQQEGRLRGFKYDDVNNLLEERTFAQAYPQQSILAHIDQQQVLSVSPTIDDTCKRFCHDSYKRERFRIEVTYDEDKKVYQGYIHEIRYDEKGRETIAISYKNVLEFKDVEELTTCFLEAQVKTLASDKDRVKRKLYNELDQVQFMVDADGYILEKVYDKRQDMIAKCQHQVHMPDPNTNLHLSDNAFRNALQPFLNRETAASK